MCVGFVIFIYIYIYIMFAPREMQSRISELQQLWQIYHYAFEGLSVCSVLVG